MVKEHRWKQTYFARFPPHLKSRDLQIAIRRSRRSPADLTTRTVTGAVIQVRSGSCALGEASDARITHPTGYPYPSQLNRRTKTGSDCIAWIVSASLPSGRSQLPHQLCPPKVWEPAIQAVMLKR